MGRGHQVNELLAWYFSKIIWYGVAFGDKEVNLPSFIWL